MNRKGLTTRSENEAHLWDIVCGLLKLDKSEQMPVIACDSLSLSTIPRSHPEELNNISLIDRLNTLEAKMNKIDALDIKCAELKCSVDTLSIKMSNVQCNDSIKRPSAANTNNDMPDLSDYPSLTLSCQNPAALLHPPNQRVLTHSKDPSKASPPRPTNEWVSNPIRQNSKPIYPHSLSRVGVNHSNALSDAHSVASMDSEGFRLPYEAKKKMKRRMIIGKSTSGTIGNTFKGAPEPDRDLFISRVTKDCNVKVIEDYLSSKDFTIHELKCVSHIDAKFQSFKLTVPLSQFPKLFNEDLWPAGIRIRKYITPRESRQHQESWT